MVIAVLEPTAGKGFWEIARVQSSSKVGGASARTLTSTEKKMGLMTILKKMKQKEKDIRLLIL